MRVIISCKRVWPTRSEIIHEKRPPKIKSMKTWPIYRCVVISGRRIWRARWEIMEKRSTKKNMKKWHIYMHVVMWGIWRTKIIYEKRPTKKMMKTWRIYMRVIISRRRIWRTRFQLFSREWMLMKMALSILMRYYRCVTHLCSHTYVVHICIIILT